MIRSLLLTLLVPAGLGGQTPADAGAGGTPPPLVFLDCRTFRCDRDFVRTEVDWVRWVREPAGADVHVLVTTEDTGAGGERYEVAFLGRGRFAAVTDTLRWASPPATTDDAARRGLLRLIRAGLVRYAAVTSALERLEISAAPLDARAAAPSAAVADPWNHWVFTLGTRTRLDGESRQQDVDVQGDVEADRITEDWKVQLDLTARYRRDRFELPDETLTTERHDYGAEGLVVKSLGSHWSAGVTGSVESATFLNQTLGVVLAPAVEYNVYPYAESTRRILTFRYSVGPAWYDYEQPTLWGRDTDRVLRHALESDLELAQPWGSARVGLELAQLLGWSPDADAPPEVEDPGTRYRLSGDAELEIRLFQGLELEIEADYSRIRDQIHLPAVEFSDEEILLELRELETAYRYGLSVGLSYTFGSIYSAVVNPRMDEDERRFR